MSGLCHHRGRVPLLLLVLLLAAAVCRGDLTGDTYDAAMCGSQASTVCGNVIVRYPFYLSNATKALPKYANSSTFCGYPGLEIICDGGDGDTGKAVMRLGNDNYTVSRIDYGGLTASLADADVANGSCPLVSHNVTIPPPPSSLSLADTVGKLIFFYRCSFGSAVDAPSRPTTIHPLTCGSSEEEPKPPSFLLPATPLPPGDWYRGCEAVYGVPVLGGSLPSDANDPAWRKGGYVSALRKGFQVSWERSTRCARCELTSGKCGYNQEGRFLGCLCANGMMDSDGCSKIPDSTLRLAGGSHLNRTKIYIIAGCSSAIFLCPIFIVCLFGIKKHGSKRMSKGTPRIESFLQKNETLHPKRYSYSEVKKMTNSYAEKLGQGGFGAVYKGSLSGGRQVAVKVLKDSKSDGEEFINEVASITRTSHVNVVTLLGFCLQGSKRALIYEYMPNGSLERYAFENHSKGGISLTWEKLFDIAIGIARGLEYLHRGCNTRIVHFDIKPHNILLDEEFNPKISDFGMAKLCADKESIISIDGARGTIGYIAPELVLKQLGNVSSKSDVYSFGMMVLEMAGARQRNPDADSESSSHYFPQWIYEHLDEYCISASETNGETTELVRKMIVVALWCIQVIPTDRPTMSIVVEMLEGSRSCLGLPPKVKLRV